MKYIFFDLDGTLHKEDLFLSFLIYSIKRNIINTTVFFPFLSIFSIAYLINPKGTRALNYILLLTFFFSSKKRIDSLINGFAKQISTQITKYESTNNALAGHLKNGDHIVIISGSPEILIKKHTRNYLTINQ